MRSPSRRNAPARNAGESPKPRRRCYNSAECDILSPDRRAAACGANVATIKESRATRGRCEKKSIGVSHDKVCPSLRRFSARNSGDNFSPTDPDFADTPWSFYDNFE